MIRRLLGLGVLAAWVGAMAWRVERDCLPRWRAPQGEGYRAALRGRFPAPEHFRISCAGQPLGDLHRQVLREADGSIALKERLNLDGPALARVLQERWPLIGTLAGGLDLGSGRPLRVSLKLSLTPEYRLRGFDLGGSLGSLPLRGGGTMSPAGLLKGTVDVGETGRERISRAFAIQLDATRPVSLGDLPLGAARDVPVGGSWDLQVVNPFTGASQALRARVEAEEVLRVPGREVPVRRIAIRQSALLEARVWVDRQGRVLRQSLLGFQADLWDEAAVPDD